jgi:ubiquinone/menaquinone biosynthesis C-methylase UbiE
MPVNSPLVHSRRIDPWLLELLRCPITGDGLVEAGNALSAKSAEGPRYEITATGLPLFAQASISEQGLKQQAHYDRIAKDYLANLGYPHTQEYMAALDRALLSCVSQNSLGTTAEICCGRGEAFHLLQDRIQCGVGVDVSVSMLEAAQTEHRRRPIGFVQGDATMLPLRSAAFDNVFMLGGIHHVSDRQRLFSEIERILKPGGTFYFREPVSDLALWRWMRSVIYRLSATLDHETERPLRHCEVAPLLENSGLRLTQWATHGFLGFCLFMNSDVLIFNRSFRLVPGIRQITRFFAKLDNWALSLPGMHNAGLQVIGKAEKPAAAQR